MMGDALTMMLKICVGKRLSAIISKGNGNALENTATISPIIKTEGESNVIPDS